MWRHLYVQAKNRHLSFEFESEGVDLSESTSESTDQRSYLELGFFGLGEMAKMVGECLQCFWREGFVNKRLSIQNKGC